MMNEATKTPIIKQSWHRNIKPAKKYPVIFAGRNTHVATVDCALSEEDAEQVCDLIVAAPAMLDALETLSAMI